ncbi:unnamed protein product [Brassica oleracea]
MDEELKKKEQAEEKKTGMVKMMKMWLSRFIEKRQLSLPKRRNMKMSPKMMMMMFLLLYVHLPVQ